MELQIGQTIKALRRRDSRTQEDLAAALGITFQAVSRWESGLAYPDMELIPPIANYFGVTIDELFGYESRREARIDEIIAEVDATSYRFRSDDDWVEDCVSTLRCGLAQFPQNERLLIKLADVLSEAGWRRHKEWLDYDDEGYIRHNCDIHKKNPYWSECIKICENLVQTAKDGDIHSSATGLLIILYRNLGEFDRAIAYANRMPPMCRSREIALCTACDGKAEARYIGEALLTMAGTFANQLVYGLINNVHHYESDLPIEKIKGAIAIFDLLCDDGNYGEYSGNMVELYLYLSRVQFERGYRDDAFESLDRAYDFAVAYEKLCDGREHSYTGTLIRHVSYVAAEMPISLRASHLPEQWPVWCNPDYDEVEREMKSDSRWDAWCAKCSEE